MRIIACAMRVVFVGPSGNDVGVSEWQAVRQLCYARSSDAVAKHHAATRCCAILRRQKLQELTEVVDFE